LVGDVEVEKGTCKCVRGILAVSELFLMLWAGGETHIKKEPGFFATMARLTFHL